MNNANLPFVLIAIFLIFVLIPRIMSGFMFITKYFIMLIAVLVIIDYSKGHGSIMSLTILKLKTFISLVKIVVSNYIQH